MTLHCSRIPFASAVALVLLLGTTAGALAQESRFAGIGAGAGFPVGTRGDAMRTGWVTEVMLGHVLPGNFASVRIGGMFARSRIDGMMDDMWMGDPLPEGGTGRLLGAMAGLMAMPNWDWDWYPYLHAGAGAINARYQGSATSFAWSAGAGAVMKWRVMDLYVEGRLVQARRGAERGEMVTVTSGLRLPF